MNATDHNAARKRSPDSAAAGQRRHRSGPQPPSLRSRLLTLVALLVLLALSAGSALLPLGAFNLVIGLCVAVVKALLVLIIFMRLRTDSPLLRMVAAVGFIWLALLVLLSLADLLARMPVGGHGNTRQRHATECTHPRTPVACGTTHPEQNRHDA